MVTADDPKEIPWDLQSDPVEADSKKLQGTWRMVAGENEGKSVAPEEVKDYRIIFEKNGFTMTKEGEESKFKGTFQLDPFQKPRTINLRVTESPNSGERGKVSLGIYQLKKDRLELCLGEPGLEPRPHEFTTKEGSKTIFFIFKKEKPGKGDP
jgi:uncharacterized protein (TIGR03067 family)